MPERLRELLQAILESLARLSAKIAGLTADAASSGGRKAIECICAAKWLLIALAALGGIGYAIYKNPPVKPVARGEVGIRVNRFSGETSEWREGNVFVFPGVHEVR